MNRKNSKNEKPSTETKNPLFIKAGWNFSKLAVIGNDKILLKMVGSHGWGEFVIKWGRWEIFKVSLHSWQRGTLYFMKTPYIAYPLFQILSTPSAPLHCPVTSNPYRPLLFALSCFFDWMDDHTTVDALFFVMIIMDLHMLSLATLIQEEPWCVFCAARRQVCWGLTHNVVFYW